MRRGAWVTTTQINQLMDQCEGDSVGGLLAQKLPDTLKTAVTGPSGVRVAATVDRSDKWLAQTPQDVPPGRAAGCLESPGRSCHR